MNIIKEPQYTIEQWRDQEWIEKELLRLHNNGVNLNSYIQTKRQIINSHSYFKEKLSISSYKKLIHSGVLDNFCNFIIDDTDLTIKENHTYTLKWMGANWEEHKDIILLAIEKLAKELNNKNEHYHFIDNSDYDNSLQHPLYTIAQRIRYKVKHKLVLENNAQVWDIILKNNNEAKSFLQNQLTNTQDIDRFLSPYGDHYQIPHLLKTLYQNDLLKDYAFKNKHRLKNVILDFIEDSNIKKVKELLSLYKEWEKDKFNIHSFLFKSKDKEISKYIISLSNTEVQLNIFNLHKELHSNTFEVLLDQFNGIDFVTNNHNYIYQQFFCDSKDKDKIKLLIEKYQFPLEKYDMLNIGYYFDKKDDLSCSKWLIDHGANPNVNQEFIKSISKSKNPDKTLKAYSHIVDIHSPDFTFNILKLNEFPEYQQNIKEQDLFQTTEKGIPVWWGLSVNQSNFNKFITQHTHELITETENDSWLGHMYQRGHFNTIIYFIKQYKPEWLVEKLSIKLNNSDNDNVYHQLFKKSDNNYTYIKTYDIDITSPVLDFVLNYTKNNLPEDLLLYNREGITPISLLMDNDDFEQYSKENKYFKFYSTKRYQVIKKILNHLEDNFPFEETINSQENVIDRLRIWTTEDDDDFSQIVEKNYKKSLHNQLEDLLINQDKIQKKKLKI